MCGCISIKDILYPALLKTIPHPPKRLFYKGVWTSSLFDHCLSVIGSRKISIYGERVVANLIPDIACAGITIVSGFMTGVDMQAHLAALSNNSKTIAVLPYGIDYAVPNTLTKVYSDIIEAGGLLLSEYDGDFEPRPWTYPQRNRIVAGLSSATLVVEAGLNSGSLITANFAKKYNRVLFVVPGTIFSDVSKGTLQLLKTNDKARLVTCSFDVLTYYNKEAPLGTKSSTVLLSNPLDVNILSMLKEDCLTVNELVLRLHVSLDVISARLVLLMLNGYILERGGNYYAC